MAAAAPSGKPVFNVLKAAEDIARKFGDAATQKKVTGTRNNPQDPIADSKVGHFSQEDRVALVAINKFFADQTNGHNRKDLIKKLTPERANSIQNIIENAESLGIEPVDSRMSMALGGTSIHDTRDAIMRIGNLYTSKSQAQQQALVLQAANLQVRIAHVTSEIQRLEQEFAPLKHEVDALKVQLSQATTQYDSYQAISDIIVFFSVARTKEESVAYLVGERGNVVKEWKQTVEYIQHKRNTPADLVAYCKQQTQTDGFETNKNAWKQEQARLTAESLDKQAKLDQIERTLEGLKGEKGLLELSEQQLAPRGDQEKTKLVDRGNTLKAEQKQIDEAKKIIADNKAYFVGLKNKLEAAAPDFNAILEEIKAKAETIRECLSEEDYQFFEDALLQAKRFPQKANLIAVVQAAIKKLELAELKKGQQFDKLRQEIEAIANRVGAWEADPIIKMNDEDSLVLIREKAITELLAFYNSVKALHDDQASKATGTNIQKSKALFDREKNNHAFAMKLDEEFIERYFKWALKKDPLHKINPPFADLINEWTAEKANVRAKVKAELAAQAAAPAVAGSAAAPATGFYPSMHSMQLRMPTSVFASAPPLTYPSSYSPYNPGYNPGAGSASAFSSGSAHAGFFQL